MDRPTVPDLVASTVSPRLRVPYTAASVVGLFSHVGFVLLFTLTHVWPLVYFNIVSIAIFALVWWLTRRGQAMIGIVIAIAEIALHQTLAVHYVGWDAGFQYYLLSMGPLPMLLPEMRRTVRFGMPAGLVLLFCGLLVIYLGAPPPYELDPVLVAALQIINLMSSFFLLWIFAYFYQRGAELAENGLSLARERSDRLLYNILPMSIVERLRRKPGVLADAFDSSSILFADLVGFTPLAEQKTPEDLVKLLDEVFAAFDDLVEASGLEKIKTIGDAYMVAAGVPHPRADHARAMADLALAMLQRVSEIGDVKEDRLQMRIGIHSGPVVAGVIGKSKFAYDLWGDTVNTAARMEAHGMPGRIHVTEATVAALGDGWNLEERGTIEIKGKGAMRTFWLVARAEVREERMSVGA